MRVCLYSFAKEIKKMLIIKILTLFPQKLILIYNKMQIELEEKLFKM